MKRKYRFPVLMAGLLALLAILVLALPASAKADLLEGTVSFINICVAIVLLVALVIGPVSWGFVSHNVFNSFARMNAWQNVVVSVLAATIVAVAWIITVQIVVGNNSILQKLSTGIGVHVPYETIPFWWGPYAALMHEVGYAMSASWD